MKARISVDMNTSDTRQHAGGVAACMERLGDTIRKVNQRNAEHCRNVMDYAIPALNEKIADMGESLNNLHRQQLEMMEEYYGNSDQ